MLKVRELTRYCLHKESSVDEDAPDERVLLCCEDAWSFFSFLFGKKALLLQTRAGKDALVLCKILLPIPKPCNIIKEG